MFHRVKSEPVQSTQPAAPKETKEESKIAMPAQQAEQDNKLMQAVTNSTTTKETTQQPVKKEEAKTMTDQAKKPDVQAAQDNSSAPRALEIPGGAYQRPGQPPVRAGGTFPGGAYPGYNPHAVTPGASAAGADRRLIIGRGITMSGEIESCDHLIVEGTVEATLKGASVLDIAESGVFYGTVEIAEATIAGRFEGDLQVSGRLTIRSGGAITGSITYKELEVEAGATIDGRLSPIGAAHDAKKNNNKQPAKKREQDSNDGELFASKAAAE